MTVFTQKQKIYSTIKLLSYSVAIYLCYVQISIWNVPLLLLCLPNFIIGITKYSVDIWQYKPIFQGLGTLLWLCTSAVLLFIDTLWNINRKNDIILGITTKCGMGRRGRKYRGNKIGLMLVFIKFWWWRYGKSLNSSNFVPKQKLHSNFSVFVSSFPITTKLIHKFWQNTRS